MRQRAVYSPGLRASQASARPPPAAPIFQRRPASPTPNTTTTPSSVILFCKCGARALERLVPWARRVAVRSLCSIGIGDAKFTKAPARQCKWRAQGGGLRAGAASVAVGRDWVGGRYCESVRRRRARDGWTDGWTNRPCKVNSEGTLRKRAIQRGDEVSLLILL